MTASIRKDPNAELPAASSDREPEGLTGERKDRGVPVGAAVQKEIIEVRDALHLPYVFDFE